MAAAHGESRPTTASRIALAQFTLPGTTRLAYLHLNLAKAWLLGAGPDVPTSSTDFAGLSITFKKTAVTRHVLVLTNPVQDVAND